MLRGYLSISQISQEVYTDQDVASNAWFNTFVHRTNKKKNGSQILSRLLAIPHKWHESLYETLITFRNSRQISPLMLSKFKRINYFYSSWNHQESIGLPIISEGIEVINSLKGPLSGMEQFLTTESTLKMMKKKIYFTLKALFLKIFKFLLWLFDSCRKTPWRESWGYFQNLWRHKLGSKWLQYT